MTYIYKSPLEERDGDFKVADGLITGATNANWDDAHDKRVDSWTFPLLYSSNVASISLTDSGIDHGGLAGLGDDDHAQYFADTLTGVRDRNYSTTGIITAGTLTDGTASLTGGVGTGYTLISPVIAGDFSWTGDSDFVCFGEKRVLIDPDESFSFNGIIGNTLLLFDPDGNRIQFGNIIDNPAYPFLGTGLVSMGGNLDVAGNITTGQYIGDIALPTLIEVDGDLEEVTIDGDLIVNDSAQLGDAVSDYHGINTAPVSGQMLTTLYTTDTDNENAIAISHIQNFNNNSTNTDIDIKGYELTQTLNGTLTGSGSRDDIVFSGMKFDIKDAQIFNGTATGSEIIGLDFNFVESGVTYTQDPTKQDFYGMRVVAIHNQVSIGRKYGSYVSISGTGESSYAYYANAVSGAGKNWAFYNAGLSLGNFLGGDDSKTFFGTGKDVSLSFDGANFNIKLDETGSNGLTINGPTRIGDTTAPTYALEVAGVVKSESGRIKNTTRYTTTQTIPVTDDQVFCNGTFTATLPAGVDGQTFRIVNSGTGTITIAPNGAELLTGENTSRTLSSKSVIILTYEPTEGWW